MRKKFIAFCEDSSLLKLDTISSDDFSWLEKISYIFLSPPPDIILSIILKFSIAAGSKSSNNFGRVNELFPISVGSTILFAITRAAPRPVPGPITNDV